MVFRTFVDIACEHESDTESRQTDEFDELGVLQEQFQLGCGETDDGDHAANGGLP